MHCTLHPPGHCTLPLPTYPPVNVCLAALHAGCHLLQPRAVLCYGLIVVNRPSSCQRLKLLHKAHRVTHIHSLTRLGHLYFCKCVLASVCVRRSRGRYMLEGRQWYAMTLYVRLRLANFARTKGHSWCLQCSGRPLGCQCRRAPAPSAVGPASQEHQHKTNVFFC